MPPGRRIQTLRKILRACLRTFHSDKPDTRNLLRRIQEPHPLGRTLCSRGQIPSDTAWRPCPREDRSGAIEPPATLPSLQEPKQIHGDPDPIQLSTEIGESLAWSEDSASRERGFPRKVHVLVSLEPRLFANRPQFRFLKRGDGANRGDPSSTEAFSADTSLEGLDVIRDDGEPPPAWRSPRNNLGQEDGVSSR